MFCEIVKPYSCVDWLVWIYVSLLNHCSDLKCWSHDLSTKAHNNCISFKLVNEKMRKAMN